MGEHVGNIAKGTGVGAFKGVTTGAKIGANPALLGATGGLSAPIGAAIGAVAGGISGGAKAKKAEDKKAEAARLIPGLEDPAQTARGLAVDRIARNIQAGTDSATQTAIQQGAETTAATQSRLSRITGGNVGSTVDALLKAQRAGGAAANQAIAQGQTRLPFFMNLGQQIANRSEQRKLELQLLERAQLSAEGAQTTKEQNVNANALVASGATGGGDISGSSTNRIQSLLNSINLNRNQEEGAGGQVFNPNQNLNQINIDPQNQPPPVDLGTVNPGNQAIGGLDIGSFAGVAAGFGS